MAKSVFVNGDKSQGIQGSFVYKEFLESIFLTDGGHKHDGVADDGHAGKIDLTAEVTGVLPAINGGIGVGLIGLFPVETPPDGYLECDGSSLLRDTYSALFAVIGTMFGVEDGVHFNLPDLRGEFIRGWDHGKGADPDAATRTDRGDGTTGDHVGTLQADELQSHYHTYVKPTTSGDFDRTANQSGVSGTPTDNTSTVGGNETRPRNITLMACIKY